MDVSNSNSPQEGSSNRHIEEQFREELDHLNDLVFIAEIIAILVSFVVMLSMIALAIIIILDYL